MYWSACINTAVLDRYYRYITCMWYAQVRSCLDKKIREPGLIIVFHITNGVIDVVYG